MFRRIALTYLFLPVLSALAQDCDKMNITHETDNVSTCSNVVIHFASNWTGVKILTSNLCPAGNARSNKIKDLHIFFNPAESTLNIQGLAPNTPFNTTIFDLHGSVISEKVHFNKSSNALIEISSLQNGLYLLEIDTDSFRSVLRFTDER